MPISLESYRSANGRYVRFREKSSPQAKHIQRNLDHIARAPNPMRQNKADAFLNLLILLSSVNQASNDIFKHNGSNIILRDEVNTKMNYFPDRLPIKSFKIYDSPLTKRSSQIHSLNFNDKYNISAYYENNRISDGPRTKRASLHLIRHAEEQAQIEYYNKNCVYSIKTRNGITIGYTLLVASEYIRNPVKGIVENLNQFFFPDHGLDENLVMVTEGVNLASDIALGLLTGGTYPLAKYLMAKSLKVAGHVVEGDGGCVKREFSPESLANLLIQTDSGITTTRVADKLSRRPEGIMNVRPYDPSSMVIQEQLPAHVFTEVHLETDIDGVTFRIKEKSPGQYVAYPARREHHPDLERKIYLDADTQRWRYEVAGADDIGLDFNLIAGEKYISLYGENYRVEYDSEKACFEIAVKTPTHTTTYPVYKTKISNAWHLSTQQSTPVFGESEINIIKKCRVEYSINNSYHPVDNKNPNYYLEGKVYEVRGAGRDISNPSILSVLEIAEELVAVRIVEIPEHGLAYEIYDIHAMDNEGYPVNFDGWRWILEPKTSINVANDLEKACGFNRFTQAAPGEKFSSPDSNGLQWDKDNGHYLKVEGNYIKIKKDNNDYYLIDKDTKDILYPIKLQQQNLEPQIGISINRLSGKVEIIDIPIWDIGWKRGELNQLNFFQLSGFNKPLYRVDRGPQARILTQGFARSEDFTAVPKMISDEDVLIVSESLEGARRYNTLIKQNYIYKIEGAQIHGVSLKQNFLFNKDRLADFLSIDNENADVLEEFSDGTGGAIFLDEVHIRLRDIRLSDISVVTEQELETLAPLAPGTWKNYLKKK
ncbi:hypothetical protein [Sodalis sp. dw_96]|uniref:hypothetical protein n=1 Tax=Sodalis sp. dw_96 TaxID=2719794 RepID=UPI001BD4146F|nr:hypothetical protein [Sodalis sp. dw_96]